MNKYLKQYIQPSFLLCAAVLAAAAGGTSAVQSYFGFKRIKLPLPLKKPFDLMDETAFGPYKVVRKQKIANPDVREQLGTEEYIQWVLEDTEADASSLTRYCHLFISYYTGTTQQVWHTPEECYFGAGNIKYAADNVTLELTFPEDEPAGTKTGSPREKVREVPVRYVIFGSQETDIWQTSIKFPVFYTFSVNGVYAATRTNVRLQMGINLKGKYSYFSKVEWKFYNKVSGRDCYATKEQALDATEKLLRTILPILEKDHWPDWQKAMQEG